MLPIISPALVSRLSIAPHLSERFPRELMGQRVHVHAVFAVAWKTQSILASIAFLGLVAFGSVLLALPIMLTWALLATGVYVFARSRGYPDLLEHDRMEKGCPVGKRARSVAFSFAKVWFSGINAFLYSRASRRALAPGQHGWRRLLRVVLLGAGLLFFGVAMCEHLLRRAGFGGRHLLRLSLLGACLNVPYRILLSAAFTQAMWQVAHALQSTASIV